MMDFDSQGFIEEFTYTRPLGPQVEPDALTLRLWAPGAERAVARIYADRSTPKPDITVELSPIGKGAWSSRVPHDCRGRYYTLETTYAGKAGGEAVDPYAVSVAPNGARGYLVDLDALQPENWSSDRPPAFYHPNDAFIYELHVRDFSSLPASGLKARGRFTALAEKGARTPGGNLSGLEHLADLGITHLHLLPIFDFDETDDLLYDPEVYNWGYNPRHFNALKGAYSTHPENPDQAILDFRRAVMAVHQVGIRVVMDVVYNHTYATESSHYHRLVPGYYHRTYEGAFSNGSGCGNELASERPMVRRMMIDSLLHWVRAYHIRGFRFDLMALLDTITINQAVQELRKIDPGFLIYGEGWTGGLSPLPDDRKCLKVNAHKTREVAYFSDDTRDSIKGHVFIGDTKGFINDGEGMEEPMKFAMTACTPHPEIDFSQLLYVKEAWSTGPHQAISYFAAHDNHTLYDKLKLTNPDATPKELARLSKFAGAILFTLQGIPFLHAGEEFLRTKKGVENSYRSPDAINSIDWSLRDTHSDVYEYYRGLARFRKAHPALRLRSFEALKTHLRFLEQGEPKLLVTELAHHAGDDPLDRILVVYNANRTERDIYLPDGVWNVYVDDERASIQPLYACEGLTQVAGQSVLVLGSLP